MEPSESGAPTARSLMQVIHLLRQEGLQVLVLTQVVFAAAVAASRLCPVRGQGGHLTSSLVI